jgi:uncharacterized protein
MRWANGGGSTTEIVAWPDRDEWQWRLSVADVDRDGPFSTFPSVDRTIALLQGNGFALTIADTAERIVSQPYATLRFSGEAPTTCRLIDGPVQDLNLMVRADATPRTLRFVTVGEPAELTGFDIAVVVAGQLHVGGDTLTYLDAIRPSLPIQRIMISPAGDGHGVLAVVSR